ncbi:MAG: Multidrug transporter permease, partial [Thermodesulfobacteriota bacterium]|nr:Multidrug transporter permease [Thermodesulfobacteriota bacterium]
MNSRMAKQIGALPFSSMLRNFRPLWIYFVQNRWALVVGMLSLLFVDFLQLIIPLVIKQAIDLLVAPTGDTG